MMAQNQFKGGRKNVDKDIAKMTEEELEVFEAIDGDEINDFRQPGFEIVGENPDSETKSGLKVPKQKRVYEEIDDDFIAQLNGGFPALELIDNKQ